MSSIMNKTFWSIPTTVCLALTACSGAPSEGELKQAIERKMKADSEALQRVVGKQGMPTAPEIKRVEKVGCKEDRDKAYKCDVELELLQNGASSKGAASMRFIKDNEGWLATK